MQVLLFLPKKEQRWCSFWLILLWVIFLQRKCPKKPCSGANPRVKSALGLSQLGQRAEQKSALCNSVVPVATKTHLWKPALHFPCSVSWLFTEQQRKANSGRDTQILALWHLKKYFIQTLQKSSLTLSLDHIPFLLSSCAPSDSFHSSFRAIISVICNVCGQKL